jgi:hypothetical protein
VDVWVTLEKTPSAYTILKRPFTLVRLPSLVSAVEDVTWTSIGGKGVPEWKMPDWNNP